MFILRLSRRDTVLILLGALCMHVFSSIFNPPFESSPSIVINTQLDQFHETPNFEPLPPPPEPPVTTPTQDSHPTDPPDILLPEPVPIDQASTLPETTIVSHAPGWTIFRNLYMADGTLFIVSSNPPSSFPDIRFMTSVSMWAYATAENMAAREPTNQQMDFLTPQEAKTLWGGNIERGQPNRIWSVEGNTLLFNDPNQFLNHYYHFVAELLLGTWAFWTGSFTNTSSPAHSPSHSPHFPSSSTPVNVSSVPLPIHRAIFAYSTADGWRDGPGFNAYFFRAAFPSLTIETDKDWDDRISMTRKTRVGARAWHFPIVLLADRSAAFRGEICGYRTQRTAAEAHEVVMATGSLRHGWWNPIREAVVKFAGGNVTSTGGGGLTAQEPLGAVKVLDTGEKDGPEDVLPMPEKVVITYISRQNSKRHLIEEDHEGLVAALEDLVDQKGWDLNIVEAERLTKDQQVRIMGETTILLGVHGNGLTHLVLMPPTRISAVIEIFFPGGFAHDYEWTTRALSMRHIAIWNDTYHTHPTELQVDYPDGFQGTQIPVYGPAVAKVIEDRIEGRL